MNSKLKYLIVSIIIVSIAVVFYQKVYIPKSTYSTVSPTKGDFDVKVFGIGNVGAKNIYAINAQTSAKIKEIRTDAGEWVKKGDLLVVMDSVDLPQLIKVSQISAKKSDSELIASQKELESLIAQKDLALVTYKRYKRLKEQSFASQSEYDKAKADLDAIIAQIDASKAHIDSAKEEVKRSQKSVKALEVKLSRYKIYAPVDGYVISKDAELQESVVPTQPILKIVDPKTVWIKAYIDERKSGNIKLNQKAEITLRSQANKKFEGYVSRIVPQSDALTQEREVDISFKKLPIPFYINEQAEVLITTESLKNSVQIPADLIVHKGENSGVWVENNSQAHFNTLDVLSIGENMAAVKNLDINSKIIVPSEKKKPLYEGSRVH
jgi:RND family efflux transporter MFP subunit